MPPDFVAGVGPTPDEIRNARLAAGLSQTAAAASVYLGHYKRWCEYELGQVGMDPARFELFLIKQGLHPAYRLV